MGFDTAHLESQPSGPWIDAFVMQMSRMGTRLPPAAVVARASQLWQSHWCDDPVQTALEEAHAKARLTLDVAGAGTQDLAHGLEAAAAVLAAGGVSPQQALMAHWLRESWEESGSPDAARPSGTTLRAASLWAAAEAAAAQACRHGQAGQAPTRATLGIQDTAS